MNNNINNLLTPEVSLGQLHNVTFIANVFMMTFFTALGLESLKLYVGE